MYLSFSAKCSTVNVLHTNHSSGNNGKYFFFSVEDFNEMAGNDEWHGKVFEGNQEGSRSWDGKVRVWKGPPGPHGRREPGNEANAGQWAIGDTIKMNHCVESGINSRLKEI